MTFDSELEKLLERLDSRSPCFILDVDRTVINTTSWYHACVTDNLLMLESQVPEFLKLNDATYGPTAFLGKPEFRQRTLELIESSGLLQAHGIKVFSRAGNEIAAKLHVYDSVKKFLNLICAVMTPHPNVLFLSAGYGEFIEGLINGLVRCGKLPKYNYAIFGSGLSFNGERISESFFVSQSRKEEVVKAVLARGIHIPFIADDSAENLSLFDCVRDAGGHALEVRHQGRGEDSPSWVEYLSRHFKVMLKEYLALNHPTISIREPPEWVASSIVDDGGIDRIGICRMPKKRYLVACRELTVHLPDDQARQCRYLFEEMFEKVGGEVLLRGRTYYYWLPQYLRRKFTPVGDRWKFLLESSFTLLNILSSSRARNDIEKSCRESRLIVFSLLDHLLCAIIACLYALESKSVNTGVEHPDLAKIKELVQSIYDAHYALYSNRRDTAWDEIEGFLKRIDLDSISAAFSWAIEFHKGMKELDDPQIIYRSVASIVERTLNGGARYNSVVVFPYGGIDLGYALNAVYSARTGLKDADKRLNITSCYYSSKKKLRGECLELCQTEVFDLFSWIPPSQRNSFKETLSSAGKVLLYDHNATTFGTLQTARDCVGAIGGDVDVAVATVNFENLANCLLGMPNSECMIAGWESILSHNPVAEYVSAFNTWGTSDKSKLLHELFCSKREMPSEAKNYRKPSHKNEFKVCRVHNTFDLDLSIANGATMIGIHAVTHDVNGYLEQQRKFFLSGPEPNASDESFLPLPLLEIDGIREMQYKIPDWVCQVIIFERAYEPRKIKQMLEYLGINPLRCLVQLQCRVEASYLERLRNGLGVGIIASIGIQQKDFTDYLEMLHEVLRVKGDFILLDMSKHQPDFIVDPTSCRVHAVDGKIQILSELSEQLKQLAIPLLIADDLSVSDFRKVLKAIKGMNIPFAGIDTQNSLEVPRFEQIYQLGVHSKVAKKPFYFRPRKCCEKFHGWRELVESI